MHPFLGIFLIAFSVLTLEISLSRLLSVITWYHLSFVAISVAMLGMTAGATRVYLRNKTYTKSNLAASTSSACVAHALSIPLTVVLLCLLPLDMKKTAMTPLAFIVATIACSLPFYFAGIAITLVLTKYRFPVGKLYASDLLGASLGCLFVLVGLAWFDAPSMCIFCSAFGLLAAMAFAPGVPTRYQKVKRLSLTAAFVILGFLNASSMYGVRPLVIKGHVEDPQYKLLERWNSYSRILVSKAVYNSPQYWGPSPLAPTEPIASFFMSIDGVAGTIMRRYQSEEDIDHLRYDVTNVGYTLGRKGDACIIGVGGGRDIQSALLFDHESVTGIEVNPIFVDLLSNEFRDFAGVANRDNVRLVVDDARSHLANTSQKYDMMQMSLIDTWAATGAGAFSLTENALYTVEAWEVFINRLAPGGVFTVSRWFHPGKDSETGRLLSLAVASLLHVGVDHPADHLALISSDAISTLLLCRDPFNAIDLARLRQTCDDLQYNVIHLPGDLPKTGILRDIVLSESEKDLYAAVADYPLNFTPPTDDSPYFFNVLRLGALNMASTYESVVQRGNVLSTITLLLLIGCLAVLAIATIVVPLVVHKSPRNGPSTGSHSFWAGAAYFSLIGASFMFLEIALLQKLSVFLGHPTYALGIVLFTIIASTGVGSFISEYLPLTRSPWLVVFPLLTAFLALVSHQILSALFGQLITQPIAVRCMASVLLLFPLGIFLGLFFPTGMKLAKDAHPDQTQWFWALNGMFGVLCSALAVFVSIYIGIAANFYLAAAGYAAVAFLAPALARAPRERSRSAISPATAPLQDPVLSA